MTERRGVDILICSVTSLGWVGGINVFGGVGLKQEDDTEPSMIGAKVVFSFHVDSYIVVVFNVVAENILLLFSVIFSVTGEAIVIAVALGLDSLSVVIVELFNTVVMLEVIVVL